MVETSGSDKWEGPLVADGMVSVTGKIYDDSMSVTQSVLISPRSPWLPRKWESWFPSPDCTSWGDDPPIADSLLGRCTPKATCVYTPGIPPYGPNKGIYYIEVLDMVGWRTESYVSKGLRGDEFIAHNPDTWYDVWSSIYDHEFKGRDGKPGHTTHQEEGYLIYKNDLAGSTESPLGSSWYELKIGAEQKFNDKFDNIQKTFLTKRLYSTRIISG